MTEEEEYCAVCDTLTTRWCADCKSAHYCSVECQTRDWNEGHELVCGTPEVGALFGIGSWKRIVEQHMRLSLQLVDAIMLARNARQGDAFKKTQKLNEHIAEWSTKFLRSQDRADITSLLNKHQILLISYAENKLRNMTEIIQKTNREDLLPGYVSSNGTNIVNFWQRQSRQIGRWFTRARDYEYAWEAYTLCLINYIDTIVQPGAIQRISWKRTDCLNIARATGRVFDGGRWERPPKATVTRV